MNTHSHKDQIELMLSEIGLTASAAYGSYTYQPIERKVRHGFRHEGSSSSEVFSKDLSTWDVVESAPKGWRVLCSKLDPIIPRPRLLISHEDEETALYTLPVCFEGLPPSVYDYQEHGSHMLTQLMPHQGLIILAADGAGLCVSSDHEQVIEMSPLSSAQMSPVSELIRLAEGRVPTWVIERLKGEANPLLRVSALGSAARYRSQLEAEQRGPEGEDPLMVAIFELIEELEGWELIAERAALRDVERLQLTLKALLEEPSQELLERLVRQREQLAQVSFAEQLVGFDGPLNQALYDLDDHAEQALASRAEDPRFKELLQVDDPELKAALAAGAQGWWLLFCER